MRITQTPWKPTRLVLIDTQSKPMRLTVYIGRALTYKFESTDPISPDEVEFARNYIPPEAGKEPA